MGRKKLNQNINASYKSTPVRSAAHKHYEDMAQPKDKMGLSSLDKEELEEANSMSYGSVEIPVYAFANLLKKKLPPDEPSIPYIVESAVYIARVEKDMACVQAEFLVNVLGTKPKWATVSLFKQSVAMTNVAVECPTEASGYIGTTFGYGDPDTRNYALLASHPGTYVVKMEFLAPLSTRGRSMKLDVPSSVKNNLTFTVPEENVVIKVSPSLDLQSVVTENGLETCIHCTFPPSDELSVQWTERIDDVEIVEKAKEEEVLVNVEQNNLHSIGEGTLVCTTLWNFHIVHGTRSMLEIQLHDTNAHVLQVDAKHLKKWEVTDGAALSETSSHSSGLGVESISSESLTDILNETEKQSGSGSSQPRILRVWLDYGVEGHFALQVVTEKEMEGTSCAVRVPTFSCIDVNREKGYLGVEARTNVEIEELQLNMLSKVDVKEMPANIKNSASSALLLGYKFLHPSIFLELDVRKHDDVTVLIAVIDEAWFETTFSDGKMLHRVKLRVRNTQKQYVHVSIPDFQFEIWSTVVKGKTVKPAQDKGDILIPLEKTDDKPFEVELVYMIKTTFLKSEGTLSLWFPKIDIPINIMFVTTWLPKNYKFGEFEGDLREVKFFSRSYTPISTGAVHEQFLQQQAQMAVPQVQQQLSNFDAGPLIDSDDEDVLNISSLGRNFSAPMMQRRSKRSSVANAGKVLSRGVLPVQIRDLQIGKPFYFEKLLVKNDSLKIWVPYKKIEKSFFKQRRIVPGWVRLAAVALFVSILYAVLAPDVSASAQENRVSGTDSTSWWQDLWSWLFGSVPQEVVVADVSNE